MNAVFAELRLPDAVQEFFELEESLFSYGSDIEYFDSHVHRVPTTENIWLAAGFPVKEVIISSSAMEAIAFAACKHHPYPDLQTLAFAALGNLPHQSQLNWLRQNFGRRQFTLVFGKDLLGRLADIKVAAGIRGKALQLTRLNSGISIKCAGKDYEFDEERLSLSAFEKAAGIRTRIRTSKCKDFETYLDQLKHYAKS